LYNVYDHVMHTHIQQHRLTIIFHGPTDRSSLNHRSDDTAVRKQVADAFYVAGTLQIEVEILADQQAQCRFKAGETEGRKEKQADQQADLRLVQGMETMEETRARSEVFGVGPPAFGECGER